MVIAHQIKWTLTILTGVTVTLAGIALTWFQVSQADLKQTTMLALQAVRANEKLLDEAQYATERAHSLLLQPCTAETRTELSRLAIGIEHIRVINLLNRSHQPCSSWDGSRTMKEDISGGPGYRITLLIDNYISPGIPVIVLRSVFSEGAVTASMTTHEPADNLKLFSTHRPLTLRAGNMRLMSNNQLRATEEALPSESLHVVNSDRYPFSVEYSDSRAVPISLFIREGTVSLLLSVLLGASVATGVWKMGLRQKTPYEQLSDAMNRGEIVPWYQPVVDAQSGRITGVEMLARQVKSDGTIVPPDRFIPIAESSDLIIPLTRKLMLQAARDLPGLLKHGEQGWHVGVNITQAHVLEPDFVAECQAFINAFQPGSIILTVELTEREPFDNSDEMTKRIRQLHEKGIAVALDDFGTGYANLEYISEVHVDIIKIDRTFVRRVGMGEHGERLLCSLIDMAAALKLQMVAEGVETEEQAHWLASRGVTWHQGYLYSPAISLSELSNAIKLPVTDVNEPQTR